MLKNEMWKIFKKTGNINAYLYIKKSHEINVNNYNMVVECNKKVVEL